MEQHELALLDEPVGIVVRPHGPGREPQTLVFLKNGVYTLQGSGTATSPFALGPQLQLTDAATGGSCIWPANTYWTFPTYDPATDMVYFYKFRAVLRLDANNTVSLVAGSTNQRGHTDGVGADARFESIKSLAADGLGALYVGDQGSKGSCIRKVDLRGGGTVPAATVTTLLSGCQEGIRGLAWHKGSRGLIFATSTAIYRLSPADCACSPDPVTITTSWGLLPRHQAGAPAGDGVSLLAGMHGFDGPSDGAANSARFAGMHAFLLPPHGRTLYILDGAQLRQFDLDTGRVSTLASLPPTADRVLGQMALLPQGFLAACNWSGKALFFVRAPELTSDAAPAAEATAASPQSLGALLQLRPAGPSSVTLRVGGRAFLGHRSVLAARSEYFRGLLEGELRESSLPEVELPDVDPEVFAPLLACLYTGVLEVKEQQLRSAAELAGRLALGEVTAQLQRRLLAAATPASMLSDLMWARQHHLMELVEGLKRQAARKWSEVKAATAKDVLKQLSLEWPELSAELFLLLGNGV